MKDLSNEELVVLWDLFRTKVETSYQEEKMDLALADLMDRVWDEISDREIDVDKYNTD